MSFNLLSLFSEKPIKVIGNESIMTSFLLLFNFEITQEMNKLVITIDGPAASGKGSISKKISEEFNFFIWKLVFITEGLQAYFIKIK